MLAVPQVLRKFSVIVFNPDTDGDRSSSPSNTEENNKQEGFLKSVWHKFTDGANLPNEGDKEDDSKKK